MREWLFADIVQRRLEEVDLSGRLHYGILRWVRNHKPRYGTRSLALLAESLDYGEALRLTTGDRKIGTSAFRLLIESDPALSSVRDVHFPAPEDVVAAVEHVRRVEDKLVADWNRKFGRQTTIPQKKKK